MKRIDLLTPEGTRDFLFEECIIKRKIEEDLRKTYENRGYSQVITPGLEFYDVFNLKARYFNQQNLYKLIDSKNRLLVIRPDCTMPIARLVATRLREGIFPLKLYYNQNIYLANPKDSGRADEVTQSGIEIIGGDIDKSDMEALSMAVEVLSGCGKDFRLEIGDSSFFKVLAEKLDISDQQYEEIHTYLQSKNSHQLNKVMAKFPESETVNSIKELPNLFGGEEVFEKAENVFKCKENLKSLKALKKIYLSLKSLGLQNKITVDLGLASNQNYYTGIMFKGYVAGFGEPVLSGGRYDTLIGDFGLDIPATGFAVNVDGLKTVAQNQENDFESLTPDVVVFSHYDSFIYGIRYCKELISKGIKAENSMDSSLEQSIDYARKRGISEIHVVDKDDVEIIYIGENDGK